MREYSRVNALKHTMHCAFPSASLRTNECRLHPFARRLFTPKERMADGDLSSSRGRAHGLCFGCTV